jgi:2-oxoglutarate dehydrogenase E2 component (dihydrolipoamide succinyltransferase)
MSIEIKVPMLPESVADALLLDWNKNVGDSVSRDEILVEVETDKVVLEVPSPVDGVLTEIVQLSGATVLAEQVLALVEEGAATGDSDDKAESKKANEASIESDQATSPAVRRILDEAGIQASDVSGSGPNGRITKEDVLDHIGNLVSPGDQTDTSESVTEAPKLADTPVTPVSSPNLGKVPEQNNGDGRNEIREPMSRLRQTIANRLVQSQQSAALLTTFNEVNMHPVMELRSKYKESFEKKHGAKLGFMSFFVKASVAALQNFPLVNARIDGTDIVKHSYNDIGIAVSSPRGLVVPVLRNCETMSYADVEQQIREYGARAQQGKIGLDELTGGTFTITNGGIFGSLLSTPIVNPPQSAILGMHKIQERPMAEQGEVVIRPMMYLALSYDHRIVDGKEAVQFLVTIKDMLEDPARLLLDC